jgi:glycosyltransferase involved in cell wall biosynthesis
LIIGIDARFAVWNRRGIGNYTLELIRHLAQIDQCNKYILYVDRDDIERILPRQINFETKKISPRNYLIWEQVMLPFHAWKDKVNVLHSTGNTAPIHLNKEIKLAVTIHDISYLKSYDEVPKSPHFYQRLGRIYRKFFVTQAVQVLNAVITVSEFAKNDILFKFPSITKDKFYVTYLAINSKFEPINREKAKKNVEIKYQIKSNYLLTVGGRDPQKNTSLLIETFLELKQQSKVKQELVLIVVGISELLGKKMVTKMMQNSDFNKDIIFISYASQNDLLFLYNAAELFIFPSFYESFGLPPLEAMACGTPVITSSTGAIPEVVGNAAYLINPRKGEDLKEAITKLLNDQSLKNELIRCGLERVKVLSWQKMAQTTLSIYQSIVKNENFS